MRVLEFYKPSLLCFLVVWDFVNLSSLVSSYLYLHHLSHQCLYNCWSCQFSGFALALAIDLDEKITFPMLSQKLKLQLETMLSHPCTRWWSPVSTFEGMDMPLEPEGICFGVLTILLSEIRWVEAFMRPTQAVETITSLVTSRKLPIFDVKMKKLWWQFWLEML